jgi:serine/threonine-protein kinase
LDASADRADLSRLLDVAHALAPELRAGWLEALPPAHAHLRARLQEILAAQGALPPAADPFATPSSAAGGVPPARPGERIGPWALVREIGRGGMGSVWLAERADGSFERRVALKLPRLAGHAGLAERLRREFAIAARLEHPHIARLYDAGIDGLGRPFIAMEYVDGVPIDQHCRANALDLRARLRLFLQVIQAVAYAHGQLVAHGDLKPANVLVARGGQARLLDFGVAQLLEPVQARRPAHAAAPPLLTPQYAAPEQLIGRPAGVLADVYSLGVVLHELLTGVLPHDGAPASAHAEDPRRARALRGELDAILRRALQRQPQARYESVQAFGRDLERCLAGEAVRAMNGGSVYLLRKFIGRHRAATLAAALAMVALAGGSAAVAVQVQRAAHAAEREQLVKAFVGEVLRADLRAAGAGADAATRRGDKGEAMRWSLVERGVVLIGNRFAGDAAAQAALFEMLAALCIEMGANRQAADYARQRVRLADARQEADEAHAAARLQLALALFGDGQVAAAEPEARTALALAGARSALGRQAELLLARVLFARGQTAEARDLLAQLEGGRARWFLREQAVDAWLWALRAEDLLAQNRPQEALARFERAIERALADEGPASGAAIEIRLAAARWLGSLGERASAARFIEPAAAALRERGGAHAVRAAFETARHAWALYSVGAAVPFAEAVAAIERSRAELAAQGDAVPPPMKDQLDFWLGEVLLDWGDLEAAVRLMEPVATSLVAQAVLPQERFELATAMGYLARDRGRHAEADDWFRMRQRARREAGQHLQPYAANDFRLLAENLAMAGRHDEAEAVLAAAPAFGPIRLPGWRPDKYGDLLRETAARVLLDRGQASAALAALPARGVDAHDDSAGLVSLRVLRGEALCRTGRPREGLELLTAQIDAVARDAHPYKPELARLRGVAATCARLAGDTPGAAALAAQARVALAALPQAAAYYRAPLQGIPARP